MRECLVEWCDSRQSWELRSQNTGKAGVSKDLVCTYSNNKERYHNVGFKNRETRMTQGALNPKVPNAISITDSRKEMDNNFLNLVIINSVLKTFRAWPEWLSWQCPMY